MYIFRDADQAILVSNMMHVQGGTSKCLTLGCLYTGVNSERFEGLTASYVDGRHPTKPRHGLVALTGVVGIPMFGIFDDKQTRRTAAARKSLFSTEMECIACLPDI